MKKHSHLSVILAVLLLADQVVMPAFSTVMDTSGKLAISQEMAHHPYFENEMNHRQIWINGAGMKRPAEAHTLPLPSLNGWLADFSHRQAMQALRSDTSHLAEISLFAVGADMAGNLAPETEFIRLAVAALNKQPVRPRILLTVANNRPRRVQDRWLIAQWLGSGEKWARHAHQLIALTGPVDGLDIDYENLRSGDVKEYVRFLGYLGQALHAQGKYLTVTVEAQTFLQAGINWSTVGQSVDRVRIMAYPYHYERTNPGAVTPPEIVKKLAKQALAQLPAEKLEIGLPIFGYDWSAKGQGKVIAMTARYAHLASRPGARAFRDPKTYSARVDYSVSLKEKRGERIVHHEVWYEDSLSIAYKIHLLQSLGIVHIGLWQLGIGNISSLFDLMNPGPFQKALSALPAPERFDRISLESPQDIFLSNDLI